MRNRSREVRTPCPVPEPIFSIPLGTNASGVGQKKSKNLVASNRNPLHLVERELVVAAVVELGSSGRLVVGHLLGLFQRASVFEVVGDTGGPESVAADSRGNRR